MGLMADDTAQDGNASKDENRHTDSASSGPAAEPKSDRWQYSFVPNAIAIGATTPIIPLYITEVLSGTVAQVGAATALSSLASTPAYMLWGELSDKLKRRKLFVVLGFAGAALAFFLMATAASVEAFTLFVILLGFLGAASAPISNILVMESTDKKFWPEKIGFLNRVCGFGHITGLLLGIIWLGYIALLFDRPNESLKLLVFVCSFVALISVFLAITMIREPEVKIERKYHDGVAEESRRFIERARFSQNTIHHVPRLGTFRHLRKHGVHMRHSLAGYLAAVLVFFIGFTVFYTPFPIFLKKVALASDVEIFAIYLFNSIAAAFMYVKAGKLVEKFGPKKLQMAAIGARIAIFPAVGFVGYALVYNAAGGAQRLLPYLSNRESALFAIGALNVLAGLCWAILSISCVSTVSYLAPENAKGEAMGAYNAMAGVGSVCGALIGGTIAYMFDYNIAFLCSAAFLAAGLIIVQRLKLKTSVKEDSGKNEISA